MSDFYVYMLRCRDGSLYTGYTVNLCERVKIHNKGKGSKYVRGRLPAELVYYERYGSKREAMARECVIKKMDRKAKNEMIEGSKFSIL